ncbi:tRNA (adenine(58)-N(1))-methyltransferase non-catalytic subunit TRM6 isoform X1 [Procambarus clarkii]|uniref:tRNA (adenine(58)-N(1))-methyltransferase non-catalytic subunit TRM6 isoform X1 n=1 Tax=Procambarus clarkii TaxID=6728 RepID=UPI001E670627|nr:tRNA (adenine(58)-N(1))-methyltransferase non-catalytic subunit TRM6-like [Procambarus clarkii]
MPEVKSEIYDGCTVVVQKGTYLKTCRVMAGRTYAFGKRGDGQFTLNIDGALGSQFGSSFRMERMTNKLFSIHKTEHLSNCLDIVKEGGEDNRDLQDDGRSQKLTSEEIIQLKGSGLTGKEVIQTITENSTTFKDKTVFSKEKYVNKKQKKYGEIITIHRPSIRLLSNMYYTQDPLKIANLRVDTLSQLLCHVNVQPGGSFAVFESGTQGLVTAAMLHRMGTTGHLVQIYHGSHPQRDAVDLMNFTVPELEVLSFINFNKLPDINLQEESATNGTEEMKEVSKEEEKQSLDDVCLETKQKKTGGDENMETSGGNAKSLKLESAKPRKFVRRQVEDVQMSSTVLRGSIEGLVVACRQYPNNILRDLLHFLKPGHPFVVFSPYKEPLMELFMEVKSQDGTNVRLSETWLRHYQVLPQRTHPEINMSGGGGYLLYGTRIMKEYNSTNSK